MPQVGHTSADFRGVVLLLASSAAALATRDRVRRASLLAARNGTFRLHVG